MDRLALLRNKRCLLAYHAARLSKLRDVCWDLGSGGVGGDPPPATASLLSQDELDFHSRYAELVLAYSEAVGGDAIGLTTQTLQPPKDVFIAVRVVRDVGTIVTESGGELDLRQGSQAWVMRRDVEHLILQGDLVQVRRPNVGSF
ncbi:hypothetical protein DFJ74DRAFT_674680 [Hyaloraphidium curvatum]|nr:hypothetical protein DFJ74DRAFT_674680 [Hyaloraphidium curvatum]